MLLSFFLLYIFAQWSFLRIFVQRLCKGRLCKGIFAFVPAQHLSEEKNEGVSFKQ
jgi:hypothetical protein